MVFGILVIGTVLSFIAAEATAIVENRLKVYFLNVGQGDAIFIQTPNGNQVLIDGGPDETIIRELSEVMSFNDRSIDLVILTHPDADHLNGLIEVLRRYEVGQILENRIEHNSPAHELWNELKKEAKIYQASGGQIINIGNGAEISIIFPLDPNRHFAKTNNNSIISKLVFGENSLLLTGDIEAQVEKELVARRTDIDSDLLKVPHHGSKTSSTQNFLEAVSPESAFIQVGADNRYGHPHPSITQRLEKMGVKYYRTDTDGRIELFFNGTDYSIKTENNLPQSPY